MATRHATSATQSVSRRTMQVAPERLKLAARHNRFSRKGRQGLAGLGHSLKH